MLKKYLDSLTQSPEGKYWTAEEQNRLADFGSMLNNVVGPVIASAATIAPTYRIHHVSGTVAIVTITPPYLGYQGTITLIADAIWTWTAAGNIAVLGTVTAANRALHLTFDGLKWYPSFVV